jgi:hypothetical protein
MFPLCRDPSDDYKNCKTKVKRQITGKGRVGEGSVLTEKHKKLYQNI